MITLRDVYRKEQMDWGQTGSLAWRLGRGRRSRQPDVENQVTENGGPSNRGQSDGESRRSVDIGSQQLAAVLESDDEGGNIELDDMTASLPVPSADARIIVGSGDDKKEYTVTQSLIRYSELLKRNFALHPDDILEDQDLEAVVFDLYERWSSTTPLPQPTSYDPSALTSPSDLEPWTTYAAKACILSRELESELFERYTLSNFIRTCAYTPLSPWSYIEDKTTLDLSIKEPLRRFSDHWIAWNAFLLGPASLATSEYAGLRALTLVPFISEETVDPRTFELDHWFDPRCGDDPNATCDHNVVAKRLREEEANRPPEPEAEEEWGRSFEERREREAGTFKSGETGNGHSKAVWGFEDIFRNNNRTGSSTSPYTSRPRPTYPPTAGNSSSAAGVSGSTPSTSSDCSSCMLILQFMFGSAISVFYIAQIVALLVLCVHMLRRRGDGIRYTTRSYDLYVAVWGGINALCPYAFPIFGFFGFPAGIASALDAKACWALTRQPIQCNVQKTYCWDPNTTPASSCRQITAVTVLIWLSMATAIPYLGGWYLKVKACDD